MREHLTPERRKELAAQAADQAGPSCLPADAVLQDMTVPMLKKVCEAVGGVDQYKTLNKKPLLQAVKTRLAELRSGASAAQVRSQPLDVPARRVVPRCAACDALTAPPAMNRVPFWLGETFSDSIARPQELHVPGHHRLKGVVAFGRAGHRVLDNFKAAPSLGVVATGAEPCGPREVPRATGTSRGQQARVCDYHRATRQRRLQPSGWVASLRATPHCTQ